MTTEQIPFSLATSDLEHVLVQTEPLWREVRGHRLFITGGTGFVGMWLVESFAWINARLGLNASACILTRNAKSTRAKFPWLAADPALSYHTGNAASLDFPSGEFSHVIHAATENDSVIHPLDPATHFDANVQSTRRVLEFARRSATKRILFTSSGAVYGRQPATLTHLPEDFAGAPNPQDPSTAYGQSKRASEFLFAAAAREGDSTISTARIFAIVGPYLKLDANFAIGNFMRDAMCGNTIKIQGDGTPLRSYLYAADMAVWLWTILLKGESGHAYNVGSDQAISISHLAKTVSDVVAPGTTVQVAQKADPNRPPARYLPDICKAREKLGLKVCVPLSEAISRTVQWHRNQKS